MVSSVLAPDMREHVRALIGETVRTVAQDRPNTIVRATSDRVLIETETGHQNWASLRELQDIADQVFDGQEVEVPSHGRSAFHMAVLTTLPEVEHALNPRRVWLRDKDEVFDTEYAELF